MGIDTLLLSKDAGKDVLDILINPRQAIFLLLPLIAEKVLKSPLLGLRGRSRARLSALLLLRALLLRRLAALSLGRLGLLRCLGLLRPLALGCLSRCSLLSGPLLWCLSTLLGLGRCLLCLLRLRLACLLPLSLLYLSLLRGCLPRLLAGCAGRGLRCLGTARRWLGSSSRWALHHRRRGLSPGSLLNNGHLVCPRRRGKHTSLGQGSSLGFRRCQADEARPQGEGHHADEKRGQEHGQRQGEGKEQGRACQQRGEKGQVLQADVYRFDVLLFLITGVFC